MSISLSSSFYESESSKKIRARRGNILCSRNESCKKEEDILKMVKMCKKNVKYQLYICDKFPYRMQVANKTGNLEDLKLCWSLDLIFMKLLPAGSSTKIAARRGNLKRRWGNSCLLQQS